MGEELDQLLAADGLAEAAPTDPPGQLTSAVGPDDPMVGRLLGSYRILGVVEASDVPRRDAVLAALSGC